MKRFTAKTIIIGLCLVLAIPLAASAEQNLKIKFAHIAPPDALQSPIHAVATGFKYILEKRSGGKLQVEIYPSGSLGNEVDVLEALNNNVIQLSMTSAAGFHRIFPPAMSLFLPYNFRNEDIALEVVNGPFGQELLEAFSAKTGLKALGIVGGYTYNAYTNNKRPILKPADMKGLKMRSMDPMGVAMFEALGASAVAISFSELYTSLQTGLVDGQTNPPFIVSWMKLNEVQNYMSIVNAQWGYQFLLCNQQWYDGLTPMEQKYVRDAARAGNFAGNGVAMMLDDRKIVELREKGMQVDILSDDQIRSFQEMARPKCLAWARENIGADWIDKLEKAITEAEKRLGYK